MINEQELEKFMHCSKGGGALPAPGARTFSEIRSILIDLDPRVLNRIADTFQAVFMRVEELEGEVIGLESKVAFLLSNVAEPVKDDSGFTDVPTLSSAIPGLGLSPDNHRMRSASGDVNHSGYLTGFLYDLMRDHLTPGVVEKIVREAMKCPDVQYCNGWLASYAKDISDRLIKKEQ